MSDTSRRSVIFHGYFYLSINKIGCYNLLIDCCLTSSEQYFSSIIYKNCLEMREVMDQPYFDYHWGKGWINCVLTTTEGRDGSAVFWLPLNKYGEMDREENVVFCSGNRSFSKSTKELFSVQRAWHSPNTLPTIVYGQVFCVTSIPWQPSPPGMRWAVLWVATWEPLPVPSATI